MKLKFFHKVGIIATVAAAGATHLAISAREELHKENRPKLRSNSYSAQEGRRQVKEIVNLLKSLNEQSTRQKLESAYIAATRTHDHGFPQSISKTRSRRATPSRSEETSDDDNER